MVKEWGEKGETDTTEFVKPGVTNPFPLRGIEVMGRPSIREMAETGT